MSLLTFEDERLAPTLPCRSATGARSPRRLVSHLEPQRHGQQVNAFAQLGFGDFRVDRFGFIRL